MAGNVIAGIPSNTEKVLMAIAADGLENLDIEDMGQAVALCRILQGYESCPDDIKAGLQTLADYLCGWLPMIRRGTKWT